MVEIGFQFLIKTEGGSHHGVRNSFAVLERNNMIYIDSEKIQKFVSAVETKKKYRPEPNLIIRHLVEEVGELSHVLYLLETLPPGHSDLPGRHLVGRELVDVLSLVNYLAHVCRIDLNNAIPDRMAEVADQYDVEIPEGCI